MLFFCSALISAFLLSDESIYEKFVGLTSSPFSSPNLAFFSKESLYKLLPSPPSINLNFSMSWLWPSLTAFGAGLRNLLPSRSSSHEQLRMGFDEEKFQALIAHIDQYIEKAIDQRIDEKNEKLLKDFNQKLTITIASSFEEKLTSFQYKLTEADLALISQRLNLIISENDKHLTAKLAKLTEEHMKVINQNIRNDLNIQVSNIKLEKQDINVDDIIASVLQSNKFSEMIQNNFEAIWSKLKEHDREISSIKLDITNIRNEIVNRFLVVNEDMKEIASNLRIIDDDIKQFKSDNADKMKEILSLIDEKIKSSTDSQYPSIDASVRQSVLKILGYEQGDYDEKSIKDWISGIFVAREYLDERLKNLELNRVRDVQQHIDKSSEKLMNEISEKIRNQITLAVAAKTKDLESSKSSSTAVGALNEDDVLRIVKEVLRIYDADKTGLVDYALESAGGQVISTRCTETYRTKSAEISIFGIPLWYPSNTPRTVISPSVNPGECWAFQGFPGFLVVQLNNLVEITGFTIEHIPKSLAPEGIIDSAPRNFSVWVSLLTGIHCDNQVFNFCLIFHQLQGLLHEMDKEPELLGNYEFSAEEHAASLQYFPVNKEVSQPYQIIELRIESNHGNPKYTCLYRFRVHGNVSKRK